MAGLRSFLPSEKRSYRRRVQAAMGRGLRKPTRRERERDRMVSAFGEATARGGAEDQLVHYHCSGCGEKAAILRDGPVRHVTLEHAPGCPRLADRKPTDRVPEIKLPRPKVNPASVPPRHKRRRRKPLADAAQKGEARR